MTLWSVETPVSFGDNISVTLARFGTLVITRSSMLFPRVAFLLSCPCQEVVVKGFNKVTRNYPIVERSGHKLHEENYRIYIHPTWVFIGWPIAKIE